jgi:hypothetical protein
MNFDSETLQQQIPYYLTAADRQVLVRELRDISNGGSADYLLSPYHDSFKADMLQGDGWRGFQLFEFDTGEKRSVQGLVMSNSCDVAPGNPRHVPARVIFAPLIKLAAYEELLRVSGIDKAKVNEKLASIRAQKTTNVFFLPAGGPLSQDHVVRLDHAHSMPVAAHRGAPDCEKLFTLSNTGFYMLILKLSFHFCRMHEKINRNLIIHDSRPRMC